MEKEWKELVEKSKEYLKSSCPLLDDEIIIWMDGEYERLKKKENQFKSLLNGDFT
jgi:hypothetical protein